LEFAWEREGGQPAASRLQTQGFASPQQAGGQIPAEGDDFYALGAVIVEMCSFMASGLGLNPAAVLVTTERMLDEVGMPRVLVDVARGLLHPDPGCRWDGAEVRRALARVPVSAIPWSAREPGRDLSAESPGLVQREVEAEAGEVCGEVCAFLEASSDPSGEDCLWPSSPQAFRTNPVSILFGACGPLEYVRRVRGACPGTWLDWTERHAAVERTPPGFALGLAGVARTLAANGRTDAALRLVRTALDSPLLEESPDLYYGAAGVGMAALEIHAATGDASLLQSAVDVAAAVEKQARQGTRGLAWPSPEGTVHCGLAMGSSGIALFLTYLGARTGEERYWALARRALAFDLSQVRNRGAYAHLPDAVGPHKTFWSPHVSFGTAGLVSAAVRLYACTGERELLAEAERLGAALTFRWTNKLWQDMGYAGWGETLLDLHAATGNPVYRGHALRMAEIILPHRVHTRHGTAFPAYGLNRVASDFAMGTSGISLFLHRLTTSATDRAFFPDHLLPGRARPAREPRRLAVMLRDRDVRGALVVAAD
ncbi:MAG TPA: protein kinase/lanthionine synthetase C family protein, partial [Longimicrobium sp.]|nr:protein kinase/lanthionine synthetase C family protein [Longimicrobium sp.]